MKSMKIGELAQKLAMSRVHAWRLAKAGVVSDTRKTKGGHFYFVETEALKRWINFMIGGKAGVAGAKRTGVLKRAYDADYGSEKVKTRRARRSFLTILRHAEKLEREWTKGRAQRKVYEKVNKTKEAESFFLGYYSALGEMEAYLALFRTKYSLAEDPRMADVHKAMRSRLVDLRDSINIYLAE